MKLKKIILSIFLSLIFIFPILENSFAESVYNLETSSFDNEITPYATYISSTDCNLNITGGSAYVNGIVKGYSNVTKTSVTLKLQQYKNSQWVTIYSWYNSGTRSCSLSKTQPVPKDYSYRVYCTVTANSETMNLKSSTVKY